ncbi:hypothetical protein DB346_18800 [Verrucomicrobia bacterium LW23]|nr:hypothetical protein DB346_18800 [Verrucomicrobia bacterium LW23]
MLTAAACFVLGAAGPLVLRRFISLEKLHLNNEVAGVKFGALAAFYSVLLAFIVVVVWTGYTDADAVCQQEAVNCQNLYRLSQGLDISGTMHAELEGAIREYVALVIKEEWPNMGQGRHSVAAQQQFQKLSALVINIHRSIHNSNTPTDSDRILQSAWQPGSLNIQQQMLAVYTQLAVDRNQRLLSSTTNVPGILWVVLGLGAVSALVFCCFFGSPNLYAQALMSAIVAMMLGLILLAIFQLDNNFIGEWGIRPHAFENVLHTMETEKPAPTPPQVPELQR